jgi:hypothetical protein
VEERDRAALEAIGYVSGSRVWLDENRATGVTQHDPERANEGLNFYTSGHGAVAILMDMSGQRLHQWDYGWSKVFRTGARVPADRNHWRRAYLLDDGSVIAIFEGEALLRIDADSKLLWKKQLRAHHAAQLMPNGELFVLTREFHLVPRLNPLRKVFEDFVAVVDVASGELLRRHSILEAMENSPYRHFVTGLKAPIQGDLFHTNSLEVLDGRLAGANPAFRSGNVLSSALKLDAIFVMDLSAQRVVWARTGSWHAQHEPRAIDGGRVLLFDNKGPRDGTSRLLEVPVAESEAGAEEVLYAGSEQHPFFSKCCGTASRLANGNTLVVETERGRAFEITRQGEIVWEFVKPDRAGADGEKIANLFDLVRIPRGSTPWLAALAAKAQAR